MVKQSVQQQARKENEISLAQIEELEAINTRVQTDLERSIEQTKEIEKEMGKFDLSRFRQKTLPAIRY